LFYLEPLLEQINHHLEQNSIIVSLGSINIIDATVIEAKQSRKRKGRNGNNTQDRLMAISCALVLFLSNPRYLALANP
jgi:hypothetical protein